MIAVIVIFIAVDAAAIVVIVNMIVAIIHHMKVNIFDMLNSVDRGIGTDNNSCSSSRSCSRGVIFVDRGAVGNVVVAIHVIDIVNAGVHFMIIATVAAISAISAIQTIDGWSSQH